MIRIVTLLLFFTTFLFNISKAQPIGCMEAKQKIKLQPLTTMEKAMIDASNERSDTIDILNYNITLEVIDFAPGNINGNCIVTFSPKMDNIGYLALDLLDLTVDSVHLNGQNVSYNYDGILLELTFPAMNSSETADVTVFYNGNPTVDPSGFGGFDFNSGYAYNLGIGLSSNPFNFGRSWFPCFDNFVERSTYDYNIITAGGKKAYCVGTFLEETPMNGDTIVRRYRMNKEIPTYLSGVAVSTYAEVNINHAGIYGPVKLQLVAKQNDINDMESTFATLADAVDALEYWYGPYVWDRVGYVTTVVGAMEHPGNIAYPQSVGLEGDDFAHKRLMSHELAHCWFGDIVTLTTPADMWFKEGNAEYGAHLFTEYLVGKEAFIDQVKDNFLNEVLRSAHIDDDGFQSLSGMPYEHTYGTHTYRKGASMIHNLRGYLGDSLFRVGQRSVLENFAYSNVNAAQYRDQLTAATGVDMTSFFDDWIYAPGFAGYEIDSVKSVPNGNEYDVTVYIQQKLRAAPHFHTNTPIDITFMDNDWNHYLQQIMVSGEFSEVEVTVPFDPAFTFLDENEKLNTAVMSSMLFVDEEINKNLGNVEFQIIVEELSDSALVRVEHLWIGPDDFGDNPFDARISSTHYWKVDGIIPTVFEATGTINYFGFSQPKLDEDLVGITEDSLILVYRPDAYTPWQEHPNYNIFNSNPNDGTGIVTIFDLEKGEYSFANGEIPMVNTVNIFKEHHLKLYPNPATDELFIEGDIENSNEISYRIFDISGKLFKQNVLSDFNENINVSGLENGLYILQILDNSGQSMGAEEFEIMR